MSVGVVIVAAGRGVRMGAATPKQLMELSGRTVLQRSVAAFDGHPHIDEIVVVLPYDLISEAETIVGATTRLMRAVAGGERRQDSVRRGVEALSPATDLILIHDAARPFVSAAVIDRVIAAARDGGAALAAVPSRDTVKRIDRVSSRVVATLPREEIWLAQTPQAFTRDVLMRAMQAATDETTFTDEAMLVERLGHEVRVVAGDDRNLKITTMDDMNAARAALAVTPRVGTGYDLHRLEPGRPLVFAGLVVPFERGPIGHSDGDVVCHAIIDALLGAAAAGDIGRHFSNSDPRWKDAAGLDLLARAVAILAERGWKPAGVDVSVILERPKLAPFVDEIRSRLAAVLGLPSGQVSVKAKTNEGVDAVGRGEAIAAHAVAVIESGGGQA